MASKALWLSALWITGLYPERAVQSYRNIFNGWLTD